jgi:hypothetical protein
VGRVGSKTPGGWVYFFPDKHNCIEPAFNVELVIMPVPFGLITK